MKKRKYTELVSLMIDPEALGKMKKVTDDSEVSMSEWLRGLVYRELDSLSVEEDTIENPILGDGGINNERC